MYGVNQENWEGGGVQDFQQQWWKVFRRPSTSYKMLLGRVALGIIYIIPIAVLFTNSGCVLK